MTKNLSRQWQLEHLLRSTGMGTAAAAEWGGCYGVVAMGWLLWGGGPDTVDGGDGVTNGELFIVVCDAALHQVLYQWVCIPTTL